MRELIPNKKFISDLEKFKHQKASRKKSLKTINSKRIPAILA